MAFRNRFIFHRQPLKTVYLTYVAVTLIFVRLPLWFLTSLVPSLRPRSTWTIRRTLFLKSIQVIFPAVFNTGSFNRLRVDPRKFENDEDEVGLVWIDASPELIKDDIKEFAERNGVEAERVPGYWFGGRDIGTGRVGQRAHPDEKVILCLHGESYLSVNLAT